ncbi:uncharacterized protein G2W53_014412 [Senna tora]|uniref:Uncharacterized protein n=1 Tax=Senna tora TaxID=362788 RepID=A0A835C441_9FABA|nr:uncharacterized protein G2W53_014412 [Senna tora]
MIGSQKHSRITRQKTCRASESKTSVRVVFANRSGFDAPIAVMVAWEERGSCLNIFRMTNRGQISETFTNYEAKDLLRNHLGMGGAWIMSQHIPNDKSRSDLRNLHELRGKRLVAQVSQTRRFALYLRTGAVLMLQLESSWHERSVDHVLTYSKRQIVVGSQKPSRITRQKTFAQVGQTRRFALYLRTVVVLMLQFEASSNGRSVDHVLTYSGCKSRSDLRNLHELRGKRLVAQMSETRRFALYLLTGVDLMLQLESYSHGRSLDHSGFHAPVGVVLAWEECGSCLNIFRMTNRGRMSETFMNYEAKDLLRNPNDKSLPDLRNLHELRGKRLVAQVSQTRWFAVYLKTVVVLMLQLESSWHGRSVDHVLTYSGRQITVGSQKPSRLMRQKTCCASESNTSVRVVFVNRSGFDAPIGVVLAWEEHGSCLNIFRTRNRGQISETLMNYEAKELLRK